MNHDLIKKLIEANTPVELVAEVAFELGKGAAHVERVNQRRAKDRKRKSINSTESTESTESSLPNGSTPPLPTLQKTPKGVKKVPQMPDEMFETFWQTYPRKVSKAQAAKAFARAVTKCPPDQIIQALKTFKFSADTEFIPHPATWLNQERWTDQPAKPPPEPGSRRAMLEAFPGYIPSHWEDWSDEKH